MGGCERADSKASANDVPRRVMRCMCDETCHISPDVVHCRPTIQRACRLSSRDDGGGNGSVRVRGMQQPLLVEPTLLLVCTPLAAG